MQGPFLNVLPRRMAMLWTRLMLSYRNSDGLGDRNHENHDPEGLFCKSVYVYEFWTWNKVETMFKWMNILQRYI